MKAIPVVTICGRPNVGKSTLFNLLTGKRIAIVDPTSGVTRDRVSAFAEIGDKHFELIDTGGLGVEDESVFGKAVTRQAQLALETASLILFMVDIKAGITPLDVEVAEMLRKHHNDKKIWLLANKTDAAVITAHKEIFHKLGLGEPFCISALNNYGINEFKENLAEHLPSNCKPIDDSHIKIAIVGRANAGKSTFINAIAQEERMIVSEIPGTTRDSVDVYFEKDGKVLVAIDTAGLKRKKNIRDNIEFYSQNRAQKAIRRSDVVILMIDATTPIAKVDKQLADFIRQEYKPVIIAINKWDLAKGKATPAAYEKYLTKTLPGIAYAPLSAVTAKTGKNVAATIDVARSLYKQTQKRISTGELNRILQQIVAKKTPPVRWGKQGKILYATQIEVAPPSFILFANNPRLFNARYKRYLFNQFQEIFGFAEVPVKLQLRARREDDQTNEEKQ